MKVARLALCAAAFAVLSASYATARTAYAATNVNLRSGAGTNSDVVTKIPAGSKLEVNNCTNGWCEVNFAGKNGFAIETAISDRAPARRAPSYSSGYGGPGYYAGGPVYSAPPVYYGPPAYYYGPGPYYYGYGPYWRRRYWW
jgi:uncharacterized protein YraI